MKLVLPYLSFDGTCREAMTFYQAALGGTLEAMTFADGPGGRETRPELKDRMIHMCLTSGSVTLMASDTMPGTPFTVGSNVSVMLGCDADAEVDRLHRLLVEGGTELMAPHDAFWGARFAMLTDRFGINWMLSHGRADRERAA